MKQVLFLCTGNYYRSRFAEALFNRTATAEGLTWRAISRGLAVDRSFNEGPLSSHALTGLRLLAIDLGENVRMPLQLAETDLLHANLVVAVKDAEHRPLLEQGFPGWASRVEYWDVHDLDQAPPEEGIAALQHHVRQLLDRLS